MNQSQQNNQSIEKLLSLGSANWRPAYRSLQNLVHYDLVFGRSKEALLTAHLAYYFQILTASFLCR